MSVLIAGPEPITSKDDLIAYLASGEKPKSDWRIGTEHEKFSFHTSDLSPVPYEGPSGVRAMLEGMQRFGWTPIMEGDTLIGLEGDGKGGNISLEPGGQFELSGGPLDMLHQTCDEVHTHLAQVKEVAGELGIGFLGLGFSPKWTRAETPGMPKGRCAIMTDYMQKTGKLGLDMMYRSCTVQVNLDFSSEADMVKKFRTSLALQPIVTALFANSPFTEGKPNGFLSFRSHVWTDTDRDRTGMLPFVFEDGFGYEQYVDYALNVPMYFVYRDGKYIDVSGQSFKDFLAGKLPGLPGELPTKGDWINHLTTIFPEARLKAYLEMRGADGGPWNRLCALPALWVGLLYDQASLDAAWDIAKGWTAEERDKLRRDVARTALKAEIGGRTVADIGREILELSRQGLKRRNRQDGAGADETIYLRSIQDTLDKGQTPAEELLAKYHGEWGGSVDPVFTEYAY